MGFDGIAVKRLRFVQPRRQLDGTLADSLAHLARGGHALDVVRRVGWAAIGRHTIGWAAHIDVVCISESMFAASFVQNVRLAFQDN